MKRPLLTALAILTLAGAAFAQPPPRTPIASDFEGATSAPTGYEQVTRGRATADMLRSVEKASSQVDLACAADRERLCADAKSAFSSGRCLDRHRREVNVACGAAMSQATMAWSAPR